VTWTGEMAALGAAVTFGLSNVLARRFMVVVTPEAGVLISIVLNLVIYGGLAVAASRLGQVPPIHPLSILWFVLGGLAGSLVGRNLAFFSIERIGASRSSTVRLSNVVFALLFGLVFLRELPRAPQIVGMAVVSLGLWLSLRPFGDAAGRSPRVDMRGVLLAVGGGAAFALGDIARRGGMVLTPSPIVGAAIGAVAALAAHLVWSVYRASARWPSGPALYNVDLWASALFNTMAVLLLWTALRHTQVAIVTVLYNLQTLVVLLATPLLLREFETITRSLILGTAMALVGTAMILLV
jgi:drug/metabolite transporter (DMT)-like permease